MIKVHVIDMKMKPVTSFLIIKKKLFTGLLYCSPNQIDSQSLSIKLAFKNFRLHIS